MTVDEITEAIIGAAIRVHKALGPGLLESAYEACLVHALRKMGFHVERQKPVPVDFEGEKVDCGFRADVFAEDQVLVEIKAKQEIHPIDYAQLLSYIRLMHREVGLMINFHVLVLKDGIKRMVNDYKEG